MAGCALAGQQARRAPGGRSPRRAAPSPGCSRSRRSSSARRCARTSTRCRSRSRSAACSRSRASGRRSGFVLLGAGDDDEALPGAAGGRGDRLAARTRRAPRGAARRGDLRGRRRARLAAAVGRRLRRLVHASTSTARCRSSRRRRRVLFALGDSQVTGTNLRPDRFKSNGLDGGHARARRGAVRRGARARARSSIVALAARGRDARHLVLTRLRRAAGVRRARQGLLAAVRHLARAVRGARAGSGASARSRRCTRRGDRADARRVPQPLLRPHQRADGRHPRRRRAQRAAARGARRAPRGAQAAGSRTCSIASARRACEHVIDDAVEPRVLVGRSRSARSCA